MDILKQSAQGTPNCLDDNCFPPLCPLNVASKLNTLEDKCTNLPTLQLKARKSLNQGKNDKNKGSKIRYSSACYISKNTSPNSPADSFILSPTSVPFKFSDKNVNCEKNNENFLSEIYSGKKQKLSQDTIAETQDTASQQSSKTQMERSCFSPIQLPLVTMFPKKLNDMGIFYIKNYRPQEPLVYSTQHISHLRTSNSQDRMHGYINFLQLEKQFGFFSIVQKNKKDKPLKDVFFHFDDIKRAGLNPSILTSMKTYACRFSFCFLKHTYGAKSSRKAVDIRIEKGRMGNNMMIPANLP